MLSIVIPVYNAEKYLKRCIESLINQSYADLEIILVDNMSQDKSADICREYADLDDRVRVVTEEKSGAASARNKGVQVANGEYITFVDSDDYVRTDAYALVIGMMDKEAADLACFSFNYIDENEQPLGWYEPLLSRYNRNTKVHTGKQVADIFLRSRDIEGFGWNKIFRREVLESHHFTFEERKTAFEDMAALFDAITWCDRVILVPKKLYYYRQINTSLTRNINNCMDVEYKDSLLHIADSARKIGLFKGADVFMASRIVLAKYNKQQKDTALEDIYIGKPIKAIVLIMMYFKSEKLKTVLKAIGAFL